MEVVAVVASVVTLAELACNIFKAAEKLNRYIHSKDSLCDISKNIAPLIVDWGRLKVLEGLIAENSSLLDHSERGIVYSTLQGVEATISQAFRFCVEHSTGRKISVTHFKWVLRDSDTWKSISSRLRDEEAKLSSIINILKWKSELQQRALLEQHFSKSSQCMDLVSASLQRRDDDRRKRDNSRADVRRQSDRNSQLTRKWCNELLLKWAASYSWSLGDKLGIKSLLTACKGRYFNRYGATFIAVFPLIVGNSALRLDIEFRCYYYNLFPDISCRLRPKNIVKESSEIIRACKNGNAKLVNDLLLRREAGPNDMTADFNPLLWYAIKKGSYDVVQLLLAAGADATITAGLKNSGLLHAAFYWKRADISRLLINHGADLEQINDYGFAPILHLFASGSPEDHIPVTEFFQILDDYGFSGANIMSNYGWTPLHRVAAYGTEEGLEFLFRHGALNDIRTKREKWIPIFLAVANDNFATFKKLLSHLGPEDCELKDYRDWSLLHVAAQVGNPRIISLLIQHGCDPYTIACSDHDGIPIRLRHLYLEPGDVAEFYEQTDNYRAGLAAAHVNDLDLGNGSDTFSTLGSADNLHDPTLAFDKSDCRKDMIRLPVASMIRLAMFLFVVRFFLRMY